MQGKIDQIFSNLQKRKRSDTEASSHGASAQQGRAPLSPLDQRSPRTNASRRAKQRRVSVLQAVIIPKNESASTTATPPPRSDTLSLGPNSTRRTPRTQTPRTPGNQGRSFQWSGSTRELHCSSCQARINGSGSRRYSTNAQVGMPIPSWKRMGLRLRPRETPNGSPGVAASVDGPSPYSTWVSAEGGSDNVEEQCLGTSDVGLGVDEGMEIEGAADEKIEDVRDEDMEADNDMDMEAHDDQRPAARAKSSPPPTVARAVAEKVPLSPTIVPASVTTSSTHTETNAAGSDSAPSPSPSLTSVASERIPEVSVKKARSTSKKPQSTPPSTRPRRSTQRVSYVEPQLIDASEEEVVDDGNVSEVSVFNGSTVAESDSEDDVASESEDAMYDSGRSATDAEIALDDILTEEDEESKPRTAKPRKASRAATTGKAKANKLLDLSLPPMSNIEDIFADMASRALKLGLNDALPELTRRPINVATMCSGTESPLIALQLISKALEKDGKAPIVYKHHFSAEIDAIKQGFIERNFRPQILFRDVREFIPDDAQTALTAYGAEVPIPGDLDMLIAGFVCKDLSKMNTRQKGLDEGGESGDTWAAVYAYANRFRPSVVLIENVQNRKSFWDAISNEWAKIGYECQWHFQDTKNHYLPQTRLRMYMIAVDRKLYGKGVKDATSRWKETMSNLQRQCSSPFEAFLVNDQSDPSTYTARSSESDWELCKLRNDRIRAEERLGTKRPVTQWSDNGSVKPPDWANRKWYQSQSTRVYDAIDIAHMQSAVAGYDSMYKMIIWDVSQNVDRFRAGMGIAPCITPSGCDFVTNKQTPLTGSQLLLLQGMPNDKLLFARESQKDCQDLAGNAMSTTVIGAAIVSALITARKSFRPSDCGPIDFSEPRREKETVFAAPDKMNSTELSSPELKAVNVAELLHDGRHSSRLCNCEGMKHLSKSSVRVCGECGHTACKSCAGNPQHMYQGSIARDSRIAPMDFERKWRPRLPPQLKIFNFPSLRELLAKIITDPKTLKIIAGTQIDSQAFSISQFHRSENHWRVAYVSPSARLDLVVDDHIRFELYVDCPAQEPANSPLRDILGRPLARGIITDSLLNPRWEVFHPHTQTLLLTLSGSSQRNSSWRNRLGLVQHKDETVPASIEVKSKASSICGKYTLLPNCGTPMSSLYKREDGVPLYLFLESDPIGPGSSDSFVFSTDCRRKSWGDKRVIHARIDNSWRPWMLHGKADVKATIPGDWEPNDLTLSASSLQIEALVPSPSAVTAIANMLSDCEHAVRVLDVLVPGRIDTKEFSNYSWALEQAKLQPAFGQWMPWSGYCVDCTCAPAMPRTLWNVDEKGEARAYEDRKSAALFERELKTRPKIIDIRATSDPEMSLISIGFNVTSLIHRARSRLATSSSEDCTTAWRLVTDHVDSAWEPFDEFYLSDNAEDAPYEGPLRLTSPLVEAQKRSLSWMRHQEKGVPLILTEVEEEIHHGLGWRAEAKAEKSLDIRGGVLADLPSFGKTVTSIGLIESEFAEMDPDDLVASNSQRNSSLPPLVETAATVIVCPPHMAKQWMDEFGSFLGQSLYETYQIRLVETFEQLQRLTVEDFQEARVIIISWKVLADERYISEMARFAAVPDPATTRGRAYDAWLDYVVEEIPKRLGELQSGPADFENNTTKVLEARLNQPEFQAIVPLKVLHGSAYQSYKEMSDKQKPSKRPPVKVPSGYKRNRQDSAAKWTDYQCPILHMFRFNRVIVDEYHYLFALKEHVTACSGVKRLSAHKRWLLSGTPALSSFADINQIASLLGASLGRDVFGPSPTKMEQRIIDDQTDVESFLSRTETRSYEWHQARHERAQDFLNRFVRQNKPELSHIPCTEELRGVELPIDHFIINLELLQYLVAQYMSVKKLKNSDNSDRAKRLHESLDGSSTAEEALLKAALSFRLEGGLDAIRAKREEQKAETMRNITEVACRAEQALASADPSDDHYEYFKKGLKSGENLLGDKEANSIVIQRLRIAVAHAKKAEQHKKLTTLAFKKLASELTRLAKELTTRIRSLRFVQNITKLLQPGSLGRTDIIKCDSNSCEGSDISGLFLISDCGHLACRPCLEKRIDAESCVDKDCDVFVRDKNLVHVPSLTTGSTKAPRQNSFGAKLDSVADLLDQMPEEDQAIIFVPNEESAEPVEDLLEAHNVTFASVSGRKTKSARIIEDFKNNKDPQTWDKVLILNLEDESASGVNLVNANHVIFVAPLLAETQYNYDSAMAQAIARCRRYRQEKKVHIYHFAALGTIDVDILEHRHKRVDAIYDSQSVGALRIKPSEKREKTRMVKLKGGMALVPKSWLENGSIKKRLGIIEEGKRFGCAIEFSETFRDDD